MGRGRGQQDAVAIVAVGEPQAAGSDAADAGCGGGGGWAETDPGGGWFEGRESGDEGGGAPADVGNNLGVNCSIKTGVFGGGSRNRKAVRALEDVGVIVPYGHGNGARRKAVAEQMTFHREAAREGVRLIADGDRDAAGPGARGENYAARTDARNARGFRIGGYLCDGRLFPDANATREAGSAKGGHQRGRVYAGVVGEKDSSGGVGTGERGEGAKFVAGKRPRAGAWGGFQFNSAGTAKLDAQAAICLDVAKEVRIHREAGAGQLPHHRVFEFGARRQHACRGGTGLRADSDSVDQQDSPVLAGQPPGDGSADDTAAGDEDVK